MTTAISTPSAAEFNGTTIDIPAQSSDGIVPEKPATSASGALTTTTGTFTTFLAPLTKETFIEVVAGVESKLEVVHQTLSMLLTSQGFETVLQEMLNAITLKTAELLGADRTTIFLLDEDKNELFSIVAEGGNGKTIEIRIPADQGIAGEVATFKKVVNIPYDFFDDPRSEGSKKLYKKTGYRTYTMLTMPLLNEQGGLVAVVQLLNKLKSQHEPDAPLEEKIDRGGFTETDQKLFEEFAPSIRLILESSKSFYLATQQQRAANALIKATESLSKASLDLEDTLKRVMDEAKELMNADRSTLWLIDRDRNDLWTKISLPDGSKREMRVPMGVGFVGQVGKTPEVLNIPFDLYDHPDSTTSKRLDRENGYRTCSLLCMPVYNADKELIGVTQLVNKKKKGEFPPYNPEDWPAAPECWKASFDQSDIAFMEAFNIQAGVALQNAKLFATVKQQEQMQRDILRSLTNGVISTDKSGKVIAANESAKQLLGFSKEDNIEGLSVPDLVKIKDGDFKKWFADAIAAQDEKARNQYYPDQTLVPPSKEEQHSVHLSINSIADASDASNVYGALVVMDDISDEKRLKTTMYRYMTQEVAEELLKGGEAKMGGDRKEVSVLFSDIRSYTTLTEKLQAEEVVSMLNEYFESMVEAIFKYKGTLDKYIGDAIMAVFGSPLPLPDHAWRSVQTAVEMRHRLADFNARRRSENKEQINIGMGINSDSVISGNIGSSKRMEFTAIGDGVNLGSRLESASKQYGCDIIISEYTFAPCKDLIWHRELDCIRVKGKNDPVRIYEVVELCSEPITAEREKIIDLYHKGRKLYLDRQFRKAWNEFATIVEELDPKDKSAKLQMERSQHFVNNPPPDDWDGVWTMTEK
ncbi:MAG TPA: adenylate/guanylate cyclase domain-containing protein [Cyanobacteria bacterium UBA11149]|nr:adenylate/guanylate cyclase domain-containing protein [Cyanobacteria bacterium UBA11367]HBE59449.1 adenylate/guanylate cyclase domain-containing protein [Cyanobacteria bacterium UBA11366]HBR72175.1 adenylate/guanylate cyclase domain-containing protein [Cyanobacteria bacterium UBA11159]HBS72444.1 adenylate/guanylate cyclase domain-containing protein [Cyanobacteria bacterium UBA11153]HBW89894.1 adenylate/guanylate cyclase domain-containing protein [Cyanobacteria bacterium UBA11149]HCA97607.1 